VFARFVIVVNNVDAMKKPNRITITLPPELDGEATECCDRTGVSLSDLARQGLVRVLLELRQTGSVKLMQLPAKQAA
jgi:hypothetical protein